MAQFATTFGSKESKVKAAARGANYSHRRQSRAGVIQVFTAGPHSEVNVIRDGDTFIVATFRYGRMAGKPTIHVGSSAQAASLTNAKVLASALKSSHQPDQRSEVMRMADALLADLS